MSVAATTDYPEAETFGRNNDNRVPIEEIEATKVLGEKLGAHIGTCDVLIRDSILQEGLQIGKT